ncbi:MAG: IclR family transcriptional regulator [Solirubrobacteraceae bacterium]
MSVTPGQERMSAIGKMLAVVETLVEQRQLSAVARMTGLPTSTVHRILQELVSTGWASETPDRRYALGARALGVLGRATGESATARAARPFLEALRDRTGHTVHFALRTGDEAVYVDKLDGRRSYHMRSRVGRSLPLHSSAIGKALLAELSEAEVLVIIGRTRLPRRTEHTITSPDALLAELRTIRGRGFSIDNEENEVHTRCIGVAVHDHRRIPIGGLSLSALAFDLDAEQVRTFTPLVVASGHAVSAALGAPV